MAVDSYNFMDYGMIDVKGLDRKQRERCAALHDELANLEFPSLMDQLSTSFHGRMRIDALFKTILFNDPSDNLYSIHELHQKLHGELLSLKKMMTGGNR